MGSEYMGPDYGPQTQPDPSSYNPTGGGESNNTPPQYPAVPAPPYAYGYKQNNNNGYQEPAYREHVTGNLYVHPSDAPQFRQAYPAYPTYQVPPYGAPGAPPYAMPPGWYPGYMQPYPFQNPKPKRDGYLLGVSITAFIGSILAMLAGFVTLFFLIIVMAAGTHIPAKPDQVFATTIEAITFTVACLLGGGFGLYHSVCALFLKKPSADFKLPWFWIFLFLYGVVLAAGTTLTNAGQAVANIPLTAFLILLCGVLPVLAVIALTVRHIHYPRQIRWPTNWRRFTLSLVAGATLAIALALVFELILTAVTARALHITDLKLDDPDAPLPKTPQEIGFLILLVSVFAPLVEEAVKPLAVVVMIGRVRSAAEAFVLGMAGGIGFAVIETAGYIGMGYKGWLDVAISRTSAGLLHGLGAAMVALGWYYMTHRNSLKRHRILIALGCWAYAIVQHAIWNGSSFLQALPGPVGQYLATGRITLGSVSFSSFLLVYVLETILMIIFLLYVTKRLRPKLPQTSSRQPEPEVPVQGMPYYAQAR